MFVCPAVTDTIDIDLEPGARAVSEDRDEVVANRPCRNRSSDVPEVCLHGLPPSLAVLLKMAVSPVTVLATVLELVCRQTTVNRSEVSL